MADRLQDYRRKRHPDRTPEPFGAVRPIGVGGRRFVIQQHAARNVHFDFRLELGGTLRSWAVPRGPSADPAERRMAVEVEDHPVEYGDFEGVIPAGNYGAGEVIVWDRGWWRPLEDPEQGLARGKLVFELGGYKLRGEWALVRTRQARQWLLLKHRDAFADPGTRRPLPAVSVLSGRTLEEVARGAHRVEEALARADALGAPRAPVPSRSVTLMLAETAEAPFSAPGWLFELKYDGYRVLAERAGPRASLRLRGGGDATGRFPEVARALAALPIDDALLDGELVVLDREGRPAFQALQARAHLERTVDVEAAALLGPATFFAFDLLAAGGRDLRRLPLADRKACLASIVPRLGPIRYAEHVEVEGEALFRELVARGVEGIVAKRADAPYRAGRSGAWLKVRGLRSADLAVVGYTLPARGRTGFGALHLAARGRDGLVYAGRVGSGFDEAALRAIAGRLAPRRRDTPGVGGAVPVGRTHRWVDPELVAEVRFADWTRGGQLRQPVFTRLRDDKSLDAIDGAPGPEDGKEAPPEPAATPEPPRPAVLISRPEKVYFPRERLTKGDLVAYYRAVAPTLLVHLRDRPVVLTRFPDGIDGKSFFQKDAPPGRPGWLRTVTVHSAEADRDLELLLLDDADGLAWVANQGTIPLHVGAARAPGLERPDWLVIDLDPKEAPFRDVVLLAQAFRRLLEELELPSFPKTSGQAGLHVLVPTGGALTHEQARTLATLVSRVVEARHGDLATTTRALAGRGGRVYLDALQNGRGKTIAAPYCVRPRDGAPVSTPLRWSEVSARLAPARHTIGTVLRRLDRLGADPLRPIHEARPDLLSALQRLGALLGEGGVAAALSEP